MATERPFWLGRVRFPTPWSSKPRVHCLGEAYSSTHPLVVRDDGENVVSDVSALWVTTGDGDAAVPVELALGDPLRDSHRQVGRP